MAGSTPKLDGEWFTPPDAMKRKMDALLSSSSRVLANSAVIRGVGCWEIGHEHASHPDLSTAFAEWIAGEPENPVDPPLDPEAGWTSHATASGMTLTLQVTDDWGSGFQGQLLLNNQTGAALNTWTIQFDAPFTVNSMWDGVYGGKSGSTHTVSNPTWGGYSLPNNSTGTIGFTGSGTKSQPSNLKLNGNPVGSSGTPFATWASTRGLSATSQGTDSDGDGRANLIEFLSGSNPMALGSDGLRHEVRRLTVNGVAEDYFCLIVPADTAAADVEYRVIASATPAMTPARLMVLHGITTTSPGKLEAVWRDTTPLGQRGFVRLEARMKP